MNQCADATVRGRGECLGMGALSQDTHLEVLLEQGQCWSATGVSQQFPVAQALPSSLTLCSAVQSPYSHGEKTAALPDGRSWCSVLGQKFWSLNTSQDLAAER